MHVCQESKSYHTTKKYSRKAYSENSQYDAVGHAAVVTIVQFKQALDEDVAYVRINGIIYGNSGNGVQHVKTKTFYRK